MAKFLIKIKAQQLRREGQSIKDIARKLKVSQSTASSWCHDIQLSQKQIAKLIKSKEKKITAGRLKGALIQRMKKINAMQWAEKQAKVLKNLSTQEFFVAGLAFYLAEGTKASGVVQFTNSDPRMVSFMLRWFRKFYNVATGGIKCSILINVTQRERENKVKQFWQKYLKIPPASFTKTRYIKSKQRKIYTNQNSYFGTFNFRVSKSTKLLYLINALTNRLLSI